MPKLAFDSAVFDLDGVITKTAKVHARAWKDTFDEYLRKRQERDAEPFKEFTHDNDYLPFVDGKPRYKGVESFLGSRGIKIPYGEAADAPDAETVCGLGNKKNKLFNELLKKLGAEVFESSVEFIKKLKKSGVKIGVASSSKNCKGILESTKLDMLFETRVDGVVSAQMGLTGKPEADIFVVAAKNMNSEPAKSIVIEDAVSGVAAGRNGGFGLVLGVARADNKAELLENGADITVNDLSEITIEWCNAWFERRPEPLFSAWDRAKGVTIPDYPRKTETGATLNQFYAQCAKEAFFKKGKPVFFLDYDGTLTPIVSRPQDAVISKPMREAVGALSEKYTVAIISGRMRKDVENLVGIDNLFYAGSHGFDIRGPGFSLVQPKVSEIVPVVDKVISRLKSELKGIKGVFIEEKKFSVAVHYRLLEDQDSLPKVKEAVDNIVAGHESLRLLSGKKVFEILPDIPWDKGQAIRWIMRALGISWDKSSVIYIGDDTTDEYAFRIINTRGSGILVSSKDMFSSARFRLKDPNEVGELFEKIIRL